jgi:hypothetical protein
VLANEQALDSSCHNQHRNAGFVRPVFGLFDQEMGNFYR